MIRTTHFVSLLALVSAACAGRVQLGDRDTGSSGGSPGTTTQAACQWKADVLATTPASTLEISVDHDFLFFRADASFDGLDLLAMPKQGGTPAALLKGVELWNFVVDDKEVFYDQGNSQILAIPRAGGDAHLVFRGAPTSTIGGMAIDGDTLFFSVDSEVYRADKSGTGIQQLARGELPSPLLVDATNVYWVNAYDYGAVASNALRAVSKTGAAAPVTLATDSGFEGGEVDLRFAMDDAAIYWADRKNHKLTRYPKAGGSPLVLAQGADAGWIVSVVTSGASVYFIEGLGDKRSFNRVPTSGGAVEHLLTLEGSAYALVHDGDVFYYTTNFAQPGAVKRLTCQ